MSDADRPVLRVVSGDPTPEEVAVLTALVATAGGGADEPEPRERRGGWNDPSWQFRRQLYPGQNGWRGSLQS